MPERMVTFGADPDKDSSWDEAPPAPRHPSQAIKDLVYSFVYHKKLTMSHHISYEDKAILGQYFSRKLKAGITPQSLRSLIDAFYASPFSQVTSPVTSFISMTVQNALVGKIELHTSDNYINWIIEGMPDTGVVDDAPELRKVLMVYCHQGLLRYPEVVIDILKSGAGVTKASTMVSSLEDLIEWKLGEREHRPDTSMLREMIDLPKELQTNRRGSLRPPAESISQAILKLKKR